MGEHTPTPWCTREDSGNCISICFDPQHPNAEGDEIASVYRDGIMTNDEMRADAALIVKAVNAHADLVGAIRDYLATFDRCGGSESVSADEFAERRQRMRDLVGSQHKTESGK